MATAQCQQELQNNFPHACPLRTCALNLGDEAAVITMHRLHFLTAAANISIFHTAAREGWGFRLNFITAIKSSTQTVNMLCEGLV